MIIRKIDAQEPVAAKKLRVAAYCRVSTENADQKESLEAQKTHYEAWIKRHSDWEFAGVFYDFGKVEVPDGFGSKKKTLMVNPQEGKVVEWIFAMLVNGSTPEEIAGVLTELQIPTGGRRKDGSLNTRWTSNGVVMVGEEARVVDTQEELTETEMEILNQKINLIADVIEDGHHPILTFTYFLNDSMKQGGSYVTMTERVTKITALMTLRIVMLKSNILD